MAIAPANNNRIVPSRRSCSSVNIKRAVNHRLEAIDVKNNRDYYKLISVNNEELNELIEEVVVNETWFFRNKTPFEALSAYVNNDIAPNLKPREKIRILSLPCSTGEEPYSIAMCLLESGITPDQLEIDAIDVSKRALTKAKRAIYGKNSFRDVEDKYVEKYFTKVRSGLHVNEDVRNIVNFRLGNLLVGSLSPHPAYYDIIFCRNLLIYFNRDIQKMAIEKLHRSLKESGCLFVGHVETTSLTKGDFRKFEHSHAFAYIKNTKGLPQKDQAKKLVDVGGKDTPKEWKEIFEQISQIAPFNHMPRPVIKQIPVKKTGKKKQKKKTSVSLKKVEDLADQGKYEKAHLLCEEYLTSHKDSAQAYFLLGVIAHAQSNTRESENYLRKSIYLDPNHEQAMSLSLLLAQQRGDQGAIMAYERRLSRIRQRQVGK